MGAAVERLTGLVSDEGRFDIPYSELRQTQIEADEMIDCAAAPAVPRAAQRCAIMRPLLSH